MKNTVLLFQLKGEKFNLLSVDQDNLILTRQILKIPMTSSISNYQVR